MNVITRVARSIRDSVHFRHRRAPMNRMIFEPLEERILLSGDLAPPPSDTHVNQAAQQAQMTQQVLAQTGQRANQVLNATVIQADAGHSANMSGMPAVTGVLARAQVSNEVVFVDASVDNYQSLVDGIATHSGAQTRNIEVIMLSGDSNGIEQISKVLAERHGLSAIHILSHGASGSLKLGNTVLSGSSLDAYADAVASWGRTLKTDGDILLYGCNVASGQSGIDFVNSLSYITGADVAASDDLTGGKGYGDWDLEYATGRIDVAQAFTASAESDYANALNFTVNPPGGAVATAGVTDIFKFDVNGLLTAAGGTVIAGPLDGLGGAAGAPDVLDFSAYTGPLNFTISNNSIQISDGANTVTANNFGKIIGGPGNDKYIFNPNWGDITIQDSAGTNDADFGAVVNQLTSSVGAGTFTLTDAAVPANTATLDSGLGLNLDLTAYKTQIDSYLTQLQSFGNTLNTFSQFTNALPGINQSLGTVLNVADMLAQFKSDISTYINGANPTSDGLVTLLSGLAVNATPNAAGTILGNYGVVTSAVNVAAGGVELGFNLDFNVTRTANWAVDLGSNAALQGIKLPVVNVSVGATFDLNAMLGIQLNATPAVFLDVTNLSGSASVNAALNAFTVDFGFMTATANGGSFNLSAALQAQFNDTAGDGVNRLSPGELNSSIIASLASRGVGANGVADITGTNPSFTFSLPVTVTGVTGVAGGTITAALANVFSGQAPTMTASNGLTDFGNIGATDMLGMLRQLDDWLSQLSGTSILNQKVPMTQNTTLGDTLNFGLAFKNDVLNTLFTTDVQGNQTPNFSSAQTLASQLTSAIQALPGMAAVTVAAAFNTTTRELRYRLDWTRNFLNTSVPVNFQLDLGSLAGIQSTSSIPITANATLGFDFGIGLNPSQQLTVAPPSFVPNTNVVPTDGQLTADATFNVTLFETTTVTDNASGAMISSTYAAPVTNPVTVTASVTNTLPADLAADVQAALGGVVSLNGKVTASYDGSRIVLAAVNPAATTAGGQTTTITRSIEVGAALANTAYTEMGLPPATLTGTANFNVTVTPATGTVITKAVTVTSASTGTNKTIADVAADVQAAVDMAFNAELRGGAIALGLGGNNTPVDFNALMARNQTFQVQIAGVTTPVQVTLAANVSNGTANTLVTNLQTAIDTALTAAGRTETVTVAINGDRLSLTAADAAGAVTVNVLQPDVVVSHQGGRIVMNATPTSSTTTTAGVTTTTNVDRSIQVNAVSSDPAYTVLGLLNYSTPANGQLSGNAEFNIKVDGTDYNFVVLQSATTANASIANLVADINAALPVAIKGVAGTTAGIEAFRVMDSGGNLTDAVGFHSVADVAGNFNVTSLIVSVPQNLTVGGGANAAVTDLGFDPNADIIQKARATGFFVDNAALSGTVTFDMSAIAASANFGFLGVDLASTAGDAISGTAALNLVNPAASGGGTRVLLSTLVNNLRGGTIGSVVTGSVAGNASVNLTMTPQAGFFTGTLPKANFSISLPANFDWLNNEVVNTVPAGGLSTGQLQVTTNFTIVTGSLSDFTNFKNMGFADIITAFNQVITYLHNTEGTSAGGGSAGSALVGLLDKKIPVINQSATDLIGLADRFAQVVTQLQANTAQSIQMADRFIKQALGLPLFQSGTTTPTASVLKFDASGINQTLRLDIPFSVAINRTLPLDLDLVALGSLAGITFPSKMKKFVGVSSTGDLNLSATANLNLALGIKIVGTSFTPFLYTGAGNTSLNFNISANGINLNFTAQAGPFGINIINGTASASVGISFSMNDLAASPGRHFFTTAFAGSDFNVGTPTGTASASLPTFFPNPSTPIGGVGQNLFTLDVKSVGGLFNQVTFPKIPSFSSLIALTPLGMLNNPAVLIDGLDTLLLTLQDSLNSQVLNVNLPLLGNALGPATQFISSFRNDLLAPLSLNLRAAGGTADQIVANTLFNVFGSATDGAVKQFGLGQLGLLQDMNNDGSVNASDIVRQGFGLTDTFGQFDFTIGQQYIWNKPIGFDLGLPAISLSLNAAVQLTINWSLRFSFGVDQNKGFYFYTSNNKPVIQVNSVGNNELVPGTVPFSGTTPNEMNINIVAQLLGVGGAPASVTGTLGFLKVSAIDGKYDSAGVLIAGTNTQLGLNFSVDLKDPNNDGKLTFAEMAAPSTSFSQIITAQATGNAHAGFKTTVDFSGLNISIPGISLPSLLPKIKFDFSGDWGLNMPSFDIQNPFSANLPSIQFNSIQLDVGSFISNFAKPLLDQIKFVLGPLDWLIGPSGMLNMRLPLISDLMGRSVSLATLAGWFDPSATIQPFLNTVKDIYNLINVAIKAAQEPGTLTLDFGSLDLASFGDLRTMKSVKGLSSPSWSGTAVQGQIPSGDTSSKAKFTRSVTRTGGSFTFDILKPVTIFKLLLGSDDVNLVTVDLPKLAFNFNYLQRFPIFPPLFATLQGGFSASVDLSIGYDTRGLTQFQLTNNPNNLVNGFFFNDLNLTTGVDKPEATLTGFIAAGAQINAVVASAGVSGGITTRVFFNLNDPDADGKVRLNEMAANMRVNSNNPLSIFDISGRVDWFFKAFAKVGVKIFGKFVGWQKTMNLGGGNIFNFNIGFARPPITAQNVNGELWVNVGPNAASRINGNIQDGNESVIVTKTTANTYDVTVNGFKQRYIGNFSKIFIDSGAGNDSITLNNIRKPVEIHGGTGNDTIILNNVTTPLLTPAPLTGSPFGINIFGDDGNDTITLAASSTGAALIRGGKGDDTITGGSGADQIDGEEGNDILNGGAGDDQLTGGVGNDTMAGGAGNDTYFFANNFGTDTVNDTGGVLDTWDFSKVTTDINFTLDALGAKADVVTSQGTVTDSVKEVTSLFSVDQLLGGRGADTFDVFQTSATGVTLNGQGGSDTYIMNASSATPPPSMKFTVRDVGNLWDRDAMIALGSAGADTVTVTDRDITMRAQVVTYGGAQSGLESLDVLGKAGADVINVFTTPNSMSVTVDGGTGADTFTIGAPAGTMMVKLDANGNPVPDTANPILDAVGNPVPDPNNPILDASGNPTFDVNGVQLFNPFYQPVLVSVAGLNGIKGTILNGPLTIKGGSAVAGAPAEVDVLTVTDAADTVANTGQMTDSFISGLGMAVGIDYATIETLNIRLGSAVDTFTVQSTIGGTTNVFGNAGADILDIRNAAGLFTADGGSGNDIITLRSTALATNATLLGQAGNDQLNVLAVAGPTTVRGGANDDVINIGSNAPLVTGGIVNNIQGPVTVSGDTGIDILNVDDSGDATSNTGTLTATTLTGLGMSDGITYATLETLNLNLGGTNTGGGSVSTLDIKGSSALTNVIGGQGQTVFNVSSDAPANLGILDQVQGVLNITSNGLDTLNISDFGRASPDTVGITRQTVTGLSHAPINYFEAGGQFSGGINVMTGQGVDTVSVLSTLVSDVTSLWTNAGNDVITATSAGPDGLLVAFAGAGNDTIDASAWNTGMVGFGDNGTVNYNGPVRNPFTIVTALTNQPSIGGNDTLLGGTGNDYLFGGFGNDAASGGSGNDFILGDSGRITFASGIVTGIVSTSPSLGGNDILTGNAGSDVLIGGAANDTVSGNAGNDFVLGDSGEILFTNGIVTRVGTLAFFTGGADTIKGGAGNDFLFGGAGHDLLFGNLSQDVMFGDNGRITLANGKAVFVVMFGQPPLDLIASTMFELYDSPFAAPQLTGGQLFSVNEVGHSEDAAAIKTVASHAIPEHDAVSESSYLSTGFLSHQRDTGGMPASSYFQIGAATEYLQGSGGTAMPSVPQQDTGAPVADARLPSSAIEIVSPAGSTETEAVTGDSGLLDASVIAIAGWQMITNGERKTRKQRQRIRFGDDETKEKNIDPVVNEWLIRERGDENLMTGTDSDRRIRW